MENTPVQSSDPSTGQVSKMSDDPIHLPFSPRAIQQVSGHGIDISMNQQRAILLEELPGCIKTIAQPTSTPCRRGSSTANPAPRMHAACFTAWSGPKSGKKCSGATFRRLHASRKEAEMDFESDEVGSSRFSLHRKLQWH